MSNGIVSNAANTIVKGKVTDKTFFIKGVAIPTVSEKPVKSFGRLKSSTLPQQSGTLC